MNQKVHAFQTQLKELIGVMDEAIAKFHEVNVSASATATDVEGSERKIVNSAGGVERTISELSVGVTKKLDEVAETVDSLDEEVTSVMDDILSKSATKVDDLKFLLKDMGDFWSDEIRRQLDLLEVAGTSVEELLRLYGDARIGGERLRSFFDGFNFDKYSSDIQRLIAELGKGAADVDDILKLLNERGGQFSRTVLNWVDAFRRGQLTLERLRELIEQMIAALGAEGTDFELLLESLEEVLAQEEAGR